MVRSSARSRGAHSGPGKAAATVECADEKLAQTYGPRKNAARKRAPTTASDRQFGLGRGAHPLGIQPMGNLLLAAFGNACDSSTPECKRSRSSAESRKPQRQANARDVGLGALHVLSDSLVMDIAGRLRAEDLCRLGVCSRAFHVVCHQEELWRALTLEEFGGNFDFEHSWRWTYVKGAVKAMRGVQSSSRISAEEGEERKGDEFAVMEYNPPLKVPDFYSDYLFQSWLCASLSPHPSWLQTDNLPRVPASSLTPAAFAARFERPCRPVVITGAMDGWPALSRWQDKQYLVQAAGDAKFAVGPVEMSMDKYLAYSAAATEERPLYIFDPRWADRCPALQADYEVPELFREDLFSVMEEGGGRGGMWQLRSEGGEGCQTIALPAGNGQGSQEARVSVGDEEADVERKFKGGRPDNRWLIVGPAMSGSNWHIDPNSTCAWNAVVTGAKKWILLNPQDGPPPGVHPSEDGTDVASPVSLPEWFMNFYGTLKREKRRVWEGVCRAGEIVFVPHGWWHCVLNLEDSIAITQNYVSRSNLSSVMSFLKRPMARELVSGLPEADRETLCERFEGRLNTFYPSVLHAVQQEEEQREGKRQQQSSFWAKASNETEGGFKFGF